VVSHLDKFKPEFIILQCGADSLEGDPITHLQYSAKSHAKAARELAQLADHLGHGRVLALGGGGYNRTNLAQAWTAVVENLF
jgi:acetoin utilization protein AcuC